MRILFIGSTKFSLRALQTIIGVKGLEVVGAITGKEEFSISYDTKPVKNVLFVNLTKFCANNKIPFYVMKKNMKEEELIEFISKTKPDYGIVVGWYHMIPKKILDKLPIAGLHASLLPSYSGGAPLVWALINGEKKTGITFFKFDLGIDNGPIIGQKKIAIKDDDTIKTLYEKAEEKGIELLTEYLPKIASGKVVYKRQQESKRTTFPQRKPEDGLIDWTWDSKRVRNFIRAQTKPYPGAYTVVKNKKIIIWDADIIDL